MSYNKVESEGNVTAGQLQMTNYDSIKAREEKKQLRVCGIVIGAIGHFYPVVNCCSALVEAGHEVHLITFGGDIKDKGKAQAEPQGIIMHYTEGFEWDQVFREAKGDEDIEGDFLAKWNPVVKAKVQELCPDIIVTDFATQTGAMVAKQLGLPFVINVPGPINLFTDFDVYFYPNMEKAWNCCGCICWTRSIMNCVMNCMRVQAAYKERFENYDDNIYQAPWIFNSFFGLDKATSLPPNYNFVGAISKEPEALMETLKVKDMELFNWLEDAKTNNEDVVYISLGSIAKWESWSINAMHKGLKDLGCRVVWSLKDEFYPLFEESPLENPKFWIRGWIPQIEVLNHEAVKACLSHAGWGGVMECSAAGVPMVTLPHFGDQIGNSQLLTGHKAAVELYSHGRKDIFEPGPIKNQYSTYKTPVYDHVKVKSLFEKVLKDPIYKQNMVKLQAISKMSGGRKRLVKIVEETYTLGNDHHKDRNLIAMDKNTGCCYTCWFILFVIGILTALGIFIALFVQKQQLVAAFSD